MTENSNNKIKIDIISGFLGAGKTTLIKKLLADGYENEKVVLIENEFGEVNIDAEFLGESSIEICEITSGCICCSLKIEFARGLKEIVERYAPTRILIEPTGVAKIGDVKKAIATARMENLEISAIATVVSAECVLDYLEGYGEFYEEQIAQADCLLLSQQDESTAEEIIEICDVLRKINPNAPIITTNWNELIGAEILEVIHGKHPKKTFMAKLKKDQLANVSQQNPFETCSFETTKKFSEPQLTKILSMLKSPKQGKILRAKGILPGDNCWLHFDFTEYKNEIRKGTPSITGMICIIGTDLDKSELKKIFDLN